MLHAFRIARTGEIFYYDNEMNSLYDNNKIKLSKSFLTRPELLRAASDYGSYNVTPNPHTIKITLGHGCNYSCSYCLQKDIGNPNERPQQVDTTSLIRSINTNLDITQLSRIELWGGETLLYWSDIKQLIEAFDNDNITWYIPTNGTTLMHKHVEFFKQLKGKVAISISHDGPGHVRLRGKDFLHKKVDVIHALQEQSPKIQFSFNPVISKTNYNLFQINDFFRDFLIQHDLRLVPLNYELGRMYDRTLAKNSSHHVISGDDLSSYSTLLTEYLHAHIIQFKQRNTSPTNRLLTTNLFHSGAGVLQYAASLHTETLSIAKTNCGVDDSRLLSLDIRGNIKTCQNVGDDYISGNINNFKGITIKHIDLTRDDFCGKCRVYYLCKSSCPLDLGPDVFAINHSIESVHYAAIQTAAFKLLFDSEIIPL